MTPERWQQVDQLFTAVIELDPEQRDAFLDSSCSDDHELRAEVEALLASEQRPWKLIERTALEIAAPLLLDERPQLVQGQIIGRYEIVSLIGKGGMGEVYLAADKLLNRKIALKLLPFDYTRDKNRLRRFQQEAQAASALNHPNILTIHEISRSEDQPFIATEFVEGETLRQHLNRAALTLPEILDIAIQIASALSAAHQAGIVHCDIKPDNVMIRPDGYVKVLDFGLAKLTEQNEQAEIQTPDNVDISSALVIGTLKYMSPEQARGSSVDARSDIFSFGVVLYEMVAGRLPFQGKTKKELLTAILNNDPTPLPGALDDLEPIVKKALRKNREDRYQLAEEILIDLKSVKERVELEDRLYRSASGANLRADVKSLVHSATVPGTLEEIDKTPISERLNGKIQANKKVKLGVLMIAAVVVGLGIFMWAELRKKRIPFQNIKLTRVTSSGHAAGPVISPDGKYVFYGRAENNKISLWLRQIEMNSESQILQPIDGALGGAAFSPDGKYVYYTLGRSNDFDIFRIPASGGQPEKLLRRVAGNVSVSNDGRRLAYVRGDSNRFEAALMTANADGTEERVISKHQGRDSFGVNVAWSPTGSSIAWSSFSDIDNQVRIFEVYVADGTERSIAFEKWDDVGWITWLPDMSGLMLVVNDAPQSRQIWFLPYPAGEARKLTNDPNDYSGVSVSQSGNALVTQLTEVESRIWTTSVDNDYTPDFSNATQLSVDRLDGNHGLCFTPDGRIVYRSKQGGKYAIWIMDQDGHNRKQLADNGNDPVVTPDGRYVVFQSYENHLCRTDVDGRNLVQLTNGQGEVFPSISPDSNWVLYDSWGPTDPPTAWRVSIEGGAPLQLIRQPQAQMPTLSPDGKFIAYGYWAENNVPMIAIMPAEGGPPIRTFVAPGRFFPLNWTPNGRALTFCTLNGSGSGNIWIQSVVGGPAHQLTKETTERVINHAWSKDGSRFAFTRLRQTSDVVLINDLR